MSIDINLLSDEELEDSGDNSPTYDPSSMWEHIKKSYQPNFLLSASTTSSSQEDIEKKQKFLALFQTPTTNNNVQEKNKKRKSMEI